MAFQNPYQRLDVNQDLTISPRDALNAINFVARSENDSSLPAANNSGFFPDVNGSGTATPVDALQVINAIDRGGRYVAARLQDDTAPNGLSNVDLLTSAYAFEFGLTGGDGSTRLEGRINGIADDPFVDLSALFPPDEFVLSETLVDTVAGAPLADGTHLVEVRVAGEVTSQSFSFTLDRRSPRGSIQLPSLVRQTTDKIRVEFDEAVASDSLASSAFELRLDGGVNAGEVVDPDSFDSFEAGAILGFESVLPDNDYRFDLIEPVFDLAGNEATFETQRFSIADPTGIFETSPLSGEEFVSVNRRTIVRFDEPIEIASITGGGSSVTVAGVPTADIADTDPPIFVIAAGKRLGGRLDVSSTARFATFHYDTPLPASTEVRLVIIGDRILGQDGIALDADGNNEPGGTRRSDFRTVSLTPISGTNVFGFVKDSSTGEPIVGATIRVDSLPEKNVVTDEDGRFELVDMPAPDFFVHIDGTTATNLPEGFVYPNVGKPFHSEPGQEIQLKMDDEPFDVFLPRLKVTDIQPLSTTETTSVSFGADSLDRLEAMYPERDRSFFESLAIGFEPGSARSDDGTPSTTAAIIPVEADRIPAPLPSFLDPSLVISIQSPGATSFDVPASVRFPNVDGLPAGTDATFFSFDHDAGRWKAIGNGTVSDDGSTVVSDGGIVQAPGWHAVQAGSRTRGDVKTFGEDDTPDVTIAGTNRVFSPTVTSTSISITNNGDDAVVVTVNYDNLDAFTTTRINQASLAIAGGQTKTIPITARSVSDADIAAIQDDNLDTTHARIITGKVTVTATSDGETVDEAEFVYAKVVARDGQLRFPTVPEEEDSDSLANDQKSLIVSVEGPVDSVMFPAEVEAITVTSVGAQTTLTVNAEDLLDPDQQPSTQMTLDDRQGNSLPAVNVNASDALDLAPFAIRRISGRITGDIDGTFGIEGIVQIGLSGPAFVPLFEIDGSLTVDEEKLALDGEIRTDILENILGFGKGVVLGRGRVFEIDRATRTFKFLPAKTPDPDAEPTSDDFKLAGMRFALTDLFFPESGDGLGLRGRVTLPDQLGNVTIDVGTGENDDSAVLITPSGVTMTGALLKFPDQSFKMFGVDAKAEDLSLRFQARGVDSEGVERGHRFELMGRFEFRFPKFDPDLVIAASFSSPSEEDGIVDLSETLGTAWSFALAEEPDLQSIDDKADTAPEPEDPPEESFVRLEFKPDGSLGLDVVGRVAMSGFDIGRVITIDNAFLQIDTVNDNYLGFVRASTPLKKVGEINALLGIEGGELDLVALGVGDLLGGTGVQIGTTPFYLQSIGGGLKDINEGIRGIDLIAAMTATLGPNTDKLFEGVTLPDWLGGLTFDPGNLLQLDVGGNISLDGLSVGGQVVVGGDEDGGLIVGTGKARVDFRDPSVTIQAKLQALGGLFSISGLNGGEFASLNVNSNFDITAQGRATWRLPQNLPVPFGFASGAELGSANAMLKFTNDGQSGNDFLAAWGEVVVFAGNDVIPRVAPAVGAQIFLSAKLPNVITSQSEAARISGAGEGEDTGATSFVVGPSEDYAMFTANWDNESTTASLTITTPSGKSITEAEIATREDIVIIETSDDSRTVLIGFPVAGTWTVSVSDATQADLGPIEYTAFLKGEPRAVSVTGVSFDAGGETLDVSFSAIGASEEAVVSVFIDSDRLDFDGMLVDAEVLVQSGGDGSTVIETTMLNLPPGEYFVYAQLEDPAKPLVLSDYFASSFTVTDSEQLPPASNVIATWQGGASVEVSWEQVTGAEGYVIRLANDAAGAGFQQQVTVNTETSLLIEDAMLESPFIVGETYRFDVIAVGAGGELGKAGHAVAVVGHRSKVAPSSGQWKVFAEPGSTYVQPIALGTGETPALLSGPPNSFINEADEFVWPVDSAESGFESVRIEITDATGKVRIEDRLLSVGAAPAGTLSGQTIDDLNRNGVHDNGEFGQNGVTVELIDAVTGAVLESLVTVEMNLDGNPSIDPETERGRFAFAGLNNGPYRIRRGDDFNSSVGVDLSESQTLDIELGEPSRGSISGSVLDDTNFDRVGNVAVAGVSVFLDLDSSGTLTEGDLVDVSDESGNYAFTELLADEFSLGVVVPTDFKAVDVALRQVSLGIDEQSQDNDLAIQLTPVGLTVATGPVLRLNEIVADSPGNDRLILSRTTFGSVLTGEASTKAIELRNVGDQNLTVTGIELASDVGFGLSYSPGVTASQSVGGVTIVPEGYLPESSSVPLHVTFEPQASGVAETDLVISTTAGPRTIRLRGTGLASHGELSVEVANNNAGGVTVGESRMISGWIRLRNSGAAALEISELDGSLGFSPADLPAEFPTTPIRIEAGEERLVDVVVTGTEAGLIGGTLTVSSNDPHSPTREIHLIATGIPAGGPVPSVGEDYVVIELPGTTAPALRGETSLDGGYEFFLAADTYYEVSLFDPDTALIAHSIGTTRESGTPTEVTQPLFTASLAPDTDGDRLPDDAEKAIGTSVSLRDSDGDGIDDFSELKLGLDPLSGLAVTTGVVASLELPGESNDLEIVGSLDNPGEQTTFIATGSHGLAIVDTSLFINPIVLGLLDLPGDATDVGVDASGEIAVVATGDGLQIVDVSDPMMPSLLRSVDVAARRVEVVGGVALVAEDEALSLVELSSGTTLQRLESGSVADIVREGALFFTIDADNTLAIFELVGLTLFPRGSLWLPDGGGKLSVGEGLALVTASSNPRGGVVTVDVSDPDSPTLLSGTDVLEPDVAPSASVVALGNSLAGLTGVAGGAAFFDLIDVSDPTNTAVVDETLRTRIPLPTSPENAKVGAGIASIAGGSSGFHVANYLSFDSAGMPPSVLIDASSADGDPGTPGIQVFEGRTLPVNLSVFDDVQIRNVELLVDGVVVRNDVSFPFDVTSIVPSLSDGSTSELLTLQVRATDTGGNRGFSDRVTVEVVEDTVPPTLVTSSLLPGTELEPGFVVAEFEFSERIDSLVVSRFELTGPDVATVTPLHFLVAPDGTTARVSYQLPIAGDYTLNLDSPAIKDIAGNPLGETAESIPFKIVLPPVEAAPIFGGYHFRLLGRATDIAEADFNGDGFRDVAAIIPSTGEHKLQVFLGSSSGVFGSPIETTLVGSPAQLVAGDFTGDAIPDLLIRDLFEVGISVDRQLLAMYPGDGSGGFGAPMRFGGTSNETGSSIERVVVGDLDGDADLDVVAITSNATLSSFRNDGAGTFVRGDGAAPFVAKDMASGDLNGDGFNDVVAVRDTLFSVQLSDAMGGFTAETSRSSLAFSASMIHLLDVNDDGALDLIATKVGVSELAVMLGVGDGTFLDERDLALSGPGTVVSAIDFNEDNKLDLVVGVTGSSSEPNANLLTGDGAGDFALSSLDLTPQPSFGRSIVGDFDNDGTADLGLLVTDGNGIDRVEFAYGNGIGFDAVTALTLVADGRANPLHLVTGDLNDDGAIDLITIGVGNGTATVRLAAPGGGFEPPAVFAAAVALAGPFLADLNEDGLLDLGYQNPGGVGFGEESGAGAASGTGSIEFLPGDGLGGFGTPITLIEAFGPSSSLFELKHLDLNEDGRVDFVARFGSSVDVFLADVAGGFDSPISMAIPDGAQDMEIADVNADGRLDIILGNGRFDGDGIVFLQESDVTFGEPVLLPTDVSGTPGALAVGDLNQDGVSDIVVADVINDELRVYFGNPSGTFAETSLLPSGAATEVQIADVNGDGILDVIAANPSDGYLSLYLGDGAGDFTDETTISMGESSLVQILAFDLTGDGFVELVLFDPFESAAIVLENRSG